MSSVCGFEECDRPVVAKGLCSGHYQQQLKGNELTKLQTFSRGYKQYKGTCSYSSCDREVSSKGLCDAHYRQERAGKELRPIGLSTKKEKSVCRVSGCDLVSFCRDLCRRHYNHDLAGKELLPFPKKVKEAECSFEGCGRPSKAINLCSSHYAQVLRGEDLRPLRIFPKKFIECAYCENEFFQDRPSRVCCSISCSARYRSGSLKRLYREGDWQGLLKLIEDRCVKQDNGCWEWPVTDKKGYPVENNLRIHRISLESSEDGNPLGVDQAHHVCANPSCVNPEHLQRVSARENIAEMNTRNYYIRRIAELEAMLADKTDS